MNQISGDGGSLATFSLMIVYQTCSGLPPQPVLRQLLDLLARIFTSQSREEWQVDLTRKAATYLDFQTLLAFDGERLVGCKLGYNWQSAEGHPDEPEPIKPIFYSWLGGVDPAYRRQGVAAELMRRQHEACQRAGYVTIRTHTYNQWRNMLILNLRHGFQIVGTQPGKHGLTIMLERRLT